MIAHATWRRMIAAEFLKLRRTRVLDLALLAPLAPAGLTLLIGLAAEIKPTADKNVWTMLATPATDVWSVLMLPLLAALLAALLAHIETANGQWKHLYALPLSRSRLYLVKSMVLLGLTATATLVLLTALMLAGVLLGFLRPESRLLQRAPDFAAIGSMLGRPLAGALFILGLHQWISHRWPSLVVALGVAVVGLTASPIALQSERWGHYFPWCLPMRTLHGPPEQLTFVLAFSSLGWAAVTLLAARGSRRREIS